MGYSGIFLRATKIAMKLAIIENQKSHFDDLCKLLEESELSCTIFPKPAEDLQVVKIADLARISLDDRYKVEGRQAKARAILQKLLENEMLDIIIIDHVLLGCSRIMTRGDEPNPCGIQLWKILTANSSLLKKIPALFLSSTLKHDSAVQRRLKELDNVPGIRYKWESKKPSEYDNISPFGDQGYFDNYIVDKIIKLVVSSDKDSLVDKLTTTLSVMGEPNFDFSPELREHAQTLINYVDITDDISHDFEEKMWFLIENIEAILRSDKSNWRKKRQIEKSLKQIPVPLDDILSNTQQTK